MGVIWVGEVPYSDDDGTVISKILNKADIAQHVHPNYESLDGRSCMRWNCVVPGCSPLVHTHEVWDKIKSARYTRWLTVGEPIDSQLSKLNDEKQYVTEIINVLEPVLTSVQAIAQVDEASRLSMESLKREKKKKK